MMILLVIGTFIIGVFAGAYLWNNLINAAFQHDPQFFIETLYRDNNDSIDNVVEDNVMELDVEKEGSQIFMWLKCSGVFISQGNSVGEALDIAKARFPGAEFKFELPAEVELNG